MHINFEDEGIVVQYLQTFLKEYANRHTPVSGVYDQKTHDILISYLQKPNTADVRVVKDQLIQKYTYRNLLPPNEFIDGGGIYNFDFMLTNDEIKFYTKPTATFYKNGVNFISMHLSEVAEDAEKLGWSVEEAAVNATDDSGSGVNRAIFYVRKTGIKNILPHKDVIQMVNLFNGKYYYKRCFIADSRWDSVIDENANFKLAAIPCKPGDSFTLTHGFSSSCEMAVGYVDCSLQEIKHAGRYVHNILNRLNSSPQGAVAPGDFITYTIPEDAIVTYMIVQLPFRDNLPTATSEKVVVKLGDVNLDGVVDDIDVKILADWVNCKQAGITPSVTLEGDALIAANVTKDLDNDGKPIIDEEDVNVLQAAVQTGTTDSLGTYVYYRTNIASPYEQDRLLVMAGLAAMDPANNIPIDQFWKSPWSVNSRFVEYLFQRVIHPYSDIEDICWLQTNLAECVGAYTPTWYGTFDTMDQYISNIEFKKDSKISDWYMYKDGANTGYRIFGGSDLQNAHVLDKNGQPTAYFTNAGVLYYNNRTTHNIVLSSGKVFQEKYSSCLQQTLQQLQLSYNNRTKTLTNNRANVLTWTIGHYDVETDKYMMQELSERAISTVGAFR